MQLPRRLAGHARIFPRLESRPRSLRLARVIRPLLVAFPLLAFHVSTIRLHASDIAEPVPRETREIDGIVFEFSPQHEALVAALAPRIRALNAEPLDALPPAAEQKSAEDDPAAALTPAHFQAARDDYLAAIARLSGLPAPTALQQECYDKVLDLAGKIQVSFESLGKVAAEAVSIKLVLVWERAELIRRLQAGDKIPGFSLSPDGQGGNFEWGFDLPPPATTDPNSPSKAQKIQGQMSYNLVNDRLVLDGEMNAAAPDNAPETPIVPESEKPQKSPTIYAIVLNDQHATLSPDELLEKVFNDNLRSLREKIHAYAQKIGRGQLDGNALAFILLRDTVRLGLNERLGSKPELRWLSEGAARYITWRLLHERHAPEVALAAYDLRANLSRTAELRSDVNFATWKPLGENPSPNARHLDEAHKTYAAMMFFAMAQRHGDDSIPRFFSELAQTTPQKLSPRAVEKAFRKTTGADLNKLLNEVVRPAPKRKAAR